MKLNEKLGNKLSWLYKYDYQNYISYVKSNNFFSADTRRSEFFHFKPTQFSIYTYFKSNNKMIARLSYTDFDGDIFLKGIAR